MNIRQKISRMAAGILAAAITGCAMPYYTGEAQSRNDISKMMSRPVFERFGYMGGSVLYNPSDINSSQLAKGAVIAVRFGTVTRSGPEESAVYRNNPGDETFGYIKVTGITRENITLSYFEFGGQSADAFQRGGFFLNAGEQADLNGDGLMDIMYTTPAAERKGMGGAMWLTFLSDRTALNTTMFAVIPQQYERSVYPGGLIGINPDGRYIVSKYDVGTNTRAAVKNIAYGDYVLDTENSSYQRYIGLSGGTSARTLNDMELDDIEDEGLQNFDGFREGEFSGRYDVKKLLSALPQNLLPSGWNSLSTGECTGILNGLLSSYTFAAEFVKENGAGGGDYSDIQESLARVNSLDSNEIKIYNRYFMSIFLPDKCPPFDSYTNSIAFILPLASVYLGELDLDGAPGQTPDAGTARTVTGEKTSEYQAYLAKKNEIDTQFSSLYSINIMYFIKNYIKNEQIKNLLGGQKKGLNVKMKFGVAGHFNISWSNIETGATALIYLNSEVDRNFTYTVKTISLFQNDEAELLKPDGTAAEKKDTEKDEAQIKKELARLTGNIAGKAGEMYKPTKDAIELFNPSTSFAIGPVPLTLGLKGKFDLLFQAALQLQLDDIFIGGTMIFGFDFKIGMNMSIKWKRLFWKISVPSGIDADPYADGHFIAKTAYYAGPKFVNPQKDATDTAAVGALISVIPVLSLEPYIGIGCSNTCTYVSIPVDFSLPANLFVGMALAKSDGVKIEFTLDFAANVSARCGLKFDATICGYGIKRDYSRLLFTAYIFSTRLLKVTTVNFTDWNVEGPQIKSNAFIIS